MRWRVDYQLRSHPDAALWDEEVAQVRKRVDAVPDRSRLALVHSWDGIKIASFENCCIEVQIILRLFSSRNP